jgi:hypothetical protein
MTPANAAHFTALWNQGLEPIVIEARQQRPVLGLDDPEEKDRHA